MGFICASLRTSGGDHYLTCTQAVRKASWGKSLYKSFFSIGLFVFSDPFVGCIYVYWM